MQVAVRSEEPYRLHCYSFLASLDTSSRSSQPDAHGLHNRIKLAMACLYTAKKLIEISPNQTAYTDTWPAPKSIACSLLGEFSHHANAALMGK